ncbi:MAG: ORF6N domain-containing protein [Thermoleophilia bacterium]
MIDKKIVPFEQIGYSIIVLRGRRVMIHTDLAKLYGVTTRRLNEQVRRNPERFPEDFMFQLTKKERDEVVANCDHLTNLRFTQKLPYAFTEHGAVMLANVLNSPQAVEASIQVVRAFIKLGGMLASHEDLVSKVDALEKKYDIQFSAVFDAIRQLMAPPNPKKKQIGFHWDEKPAPARKKSHTKKKAPAQKKMPEMPAKPV